MGSLTYPERLNFYRAVLSHVVGARPGSTWVHNLVFCGPSLPFELHDPEQCHPTGESRSLMLDRILERMSRFESLFVDEPTNVLVWVK